jgi:hypothetical protein
MGLRDGNQSANGITRLVEFKNAEWAVGVLVRCA